MREVVIEMNYDLLMEEQIKNMNEGSTLLMHACCAPCSSACLERLGNYFDISILFYNPNITDKDEYLKRVEEIKKFISGFKTKYPIKLIEGRYDPKEFSDIEDSDYIVGILTADRIQSVS